MFPDLLVKSFKDMDIAVLENILNEVSNYCEKPVQNQSENDLEQPYVWNFYHSFFFSFTVCSTVGKLVFDKLKILTN